MKSALAVIFAITLAFASTQATALACGGGGDMGHKGEYSTPAE